ncbi:MAG: TetR/AcrR family transcriptional regulator [Dehalococcoidia bacterium]|nr:TetR/AcrR family transcriptional regulator [Dehalococcoidia bacterium]
MERTPESTRDRILAAATSLFHQYGQRGATTRRIAAAAGVNEVTLFRHFASKEGLLAAAIDRQSDRALEYLRAGTLPEVPGDVRSELRSRMLETLGGFMGSRQAVRTSLFEWGRDPEMDERLMRVTNSIYDEFAHYLAAAAEAGLVRQDVDPHTTSVALMAVLFSDGLLRDVMPGRFPAPPEETLDAYLTILLDGLLPRNDGSAPA